MTGLLALSFAATLALPPSLPSGGDLEARLVSVRVELDVFASAGGHEKCNVKVLAPLCVPPQVPLQISLTSEPPGEVTTWRIDADGFLSADLKDQAGEKHLTLTILMETLVMNGVGFDDAAKKPTLFKSAPGSAVKPWLRPLPGGKLDDPDVVKAAKELKGKAGDVIALVRAIDELVARRVHDAPSASNEAIEALRTGRGSQLAAARLAATLAIAHGVPSRVLVAIPSRAGGDLHYLDEFHAGELGWLRFDLLHRKGVAFPWPESEDIAMTTIDADSPLGADARPRAYFCRGGLTAGPKRGGAPYVCSDRAATTCSRGVAKEILPVLAAAFATAQKSPRPGDGRIDLLATPEAQKCRALVDWSAPFAKALHDSTDAK